MEREEDIGYMESQLRQRRHKPKPANCYTIYESRTKSGLVYDRLAIAADVLAEEGAKPEDYFRYAESFSIVKVGEIKVFGSVKLLGKHFSVFEREV